MSSRGRFHIWFAAIAFAWSSWCLYWPSYTLAKDSAGAMAEANETARVCLQQPGLTSEDCTRDKVLRQQRLLGQAAPRGQSALQIFAGNTDGEAASFMAWLILLPLGLAYAVARISFEVFRLLIRSLRQNAARPVAP